MFGPGVTHGFRVPPLRIVDIRRRSMAARKILVPGNAPFFRMGDFVEQLFRYGIVIDVVEPQELPIGVEACCRPDHAYIQFSDPVYEAACRDDPRARFTVVHEVGHILLAHTRAFNRDDGRRHQPYEDSEWQANQVAAEILMPVEDILSNGYRTAAELQLAYQVSAPAADLRIRKLVEKGHM